MAKRGETRPWRMTFRYTDSGIGGTNAYGSRDEAEMFAEKIRENADRRDLQVTITIQHREHRP